MIRNMSRAQYPYSTVDSAISVFDNSNLYRPLAWLDAVNELDWLNELDNGQMLTLLEHLPSDGMELTNPRVNWTELERLESATTLSASASSSATSLTLVDPYVAVVGSFLVTPADGEVMEVTAINYTTGVATVTRSRGGTTAVAKAAGDAVLVLPSYMAEKSGVRGGMGQYPGEPMYNYISIASQSLEVTKMQDNSDVYDNWGQIPRAQVETVLSFRRKLGFALYFAARDTYLTSDEGQMYIGGGAMHFIKSNVLDLGSKAGNANWITLNDFFEGTFVADASSQEKSMWCGQDLYRMLLRFARENNRLDTAPYFEDQIFKTDTFTISTEEGHRVNVFLDKYGLKSGTPYYLGDWGFVFDLAHIKGGHFKGMQAQWFQNIQDNDNVMTRKDAYFQSWALVMKHESTHGLIRGGIDRSVAR